jgi:helicase
LVICANEGHWPLVELVARQSPGEPVYGALRVLIAKLKASLALDSTLSNELLEADPDLYPLIDGIDSTLIDLAAEEVGEEAFIQQAMKLADETFASLQAQEDSKILLRDVFALRARRVEGIRSAGRLSWIRETGTRVRILDVVEKGLLHRREIWDDIIDPIEPGFVGLVLDWAWEQKEFQDALREAYRLENEDDINSVRESFSEILISWLGGDRFIRISERSELGIDDLLGVHTHVVSFVLQTLVEQGILLLGKLLESQQKSLSSAVLRFPDHLRFGVPTTNAKVLAAGGVRHRQAAVELGRWLTGDQGVLVAPLSTLCSLARQEILAQRSEWDVRLGVLVVKNTLTDLSTILRDESETPE